MPASKTYRLFPLPPSLYFPFFFSPLKNRLGVNGGHFTREPGERQSLSLFPPLPPLSSSFSSPPIERKSRDPRPTTAGELLRNVSSFPPPPLPSLSFPSVGRSTQCRVLAPPFPPPLFLTVRQDQVQLMPVVESGGSESSRASPSAHFSILFSPPFPPLPSLIRQCC